MHAQPQLSTRVRYTVGCSRLEATHGGRVKSRPATQSLQARRRQHAKPRMFWCSRPSEAAPHGELRLHAMTGSTHVTQQRLPLRSSRPCLAGRVRPAAPNFNLGRRFQNVASSEMHLQQAVSGARALTSTVHLRALLALHFIHARSRGSKRGRTCSALGGRRGCRRGRAPLPRPRRARLRAARARPAQVALERGIVHVARR